MARKIIFQERINEPSDFSFRFVFWASVPAARQTFNADPTETSVVKDVTAAELTAIQNGQIIEQVNTVNYPAGTTIASIQADLVNKFNAFQAQVTALNPWKYFGTTWDGTAWTVKQTA